jgi:dTDP-4-amino-4,6-dideoxygalactose transaminase
MNPYRYVEDFEEVLSEYTGAPFVVCCESCSAALYMCCFRDRVSELSRPVEFPRFTYPSAPNAVIHAGGKVSFSDMAGDWQKRGIYRMHPTRIYDSAKMISKNMYQSLNRIEDFPGALICLSFHAKKALPIGRGGAILCNIEEDAEWFKCMRHDGRHHGEELPNDTLVGPGWNFLMQPEQAARGLTLMNQLKDINICAPDPYQDLSKYEWYKR